MKKSVKMMFVAAGLLTVITAVAATKSQKVCTGNRKDKMEEKGVTTFVLFKVVA